MDNISDRDRIKWTETLTRLRDDFHRPLRREHREDIDMLIFAITRGTDSSIFFDFLDSLPRSAREGTVGDCLLNKKFKYRDGVKVVIFLGSSTHEYTTGPYKSAVVYSSTRKGDFYNPNFNLDNIHRVNWIPCREMRPKSASNFYMFPLLFLMLVIFALLSLRQV